MKKTAVLATLVVFLCTAGFADQVRVGTTFSRKQCEYLGLDWKDTYLAILDEGFDIIRLGAYWDEIEPEEDKYDFSFLDWQIKEARKKNIPVVLTVGMKAPRWPEYFIPDWVLAKARPAYGSDLGKNGYIGERAIKFIEKVVLRYRGETILCYWQVENEPLTRIGEKNWFIGIPFVEREAAVVRRLDQKGRPILMTVAVYPNRFLRFFADLFGARDSVRESVKLCDIIGINVYPVVGSKFLGVGLYFGSTAEGRKRYFSEILSIIREGGKKAWVTELQAEPWEPGHLAYKEEKEPLTGRTGLTEEAFREIRELGVDTIFLWGAEYWRYRRRRYGEMKWDETLEEILKEQ